MQICQGRTGRAGAGTINATSGTGPGLKAIRDRFANTGLKTRGESCGYSERPCEGRCDKLARTVPQLRANAQRILGALAGAASRSTRARCTRAAAEESGVPVRRGWFQCLSALRARLFSCGVLRPATQGYFSLLVQREVTKRKHAPEGTKTPLALPSSAPKLARQYFHVLRARRASQARPFGLAGRRYQGAGVPYGDQSQKHRSMSVGF